MRVNMSDSEPIILFDLSCRPPQASWSLNPWKTRYVLNYKGISYETKWLEYPEIKPTLEPHVPANKEGVDYTSPAIKLPNGTYIMDSRLIADKLESLYPTPSLHLDSAALAKLEPIMRQLMPALAGLYIPLVPKRILNNASLDHWYEKREAKHGMSLDELAKTKGGDVAYNAAKPYLEEITALLKEDSSGPYFMGEEVSYSDFIWGGFLHFFTKIGKEEFSRVLEVAGDRDVHLKLMDALKEWTARDDR